jgi:excisionase family DNA binding protein
MSLENKGRNEETLSVQEAAKILEVKDRHLRWLVREGYIIPVDKGPRRGEMRFRKEDIYALLEAREGGYDLPKTASAALQALALSRSTAHRLDELYTFLGLKSGLLPVDDDSVMALHIQVQMRLHSSFEEVEPPELMDWAYKLNAIDENYLALVEGVTAAPHPWASYLTLIEKIILEASRGPLSSYPAHRHAMGFLIAARNNLRNVSYFYLRTKKGERAADQTFPDDLDEEILAHIVPH